MRDSLLIIAALSFLTVTPSYAAPDGKTQITQTGKSHMEFECTSRPQLRLHVRSGEIRVVGSDDVKISVDLTGKNADKIQDVRARLSCGDSVGN